MSTLQGALLGFIVTAFLGLALIIFAQHEKIASQQARYEALLKNSSALQAENIDWKNAALQQNAKIAQLAVRKAVPAADTKHITDFAARIRKLQVSGDECAGARMIESFYLKNRP